MQKIQTEFLYKQICGEVNISLAGKIKYNTVFVVFVYNEHVGYFRFNPVCLAIIQLIKPNLLLRSQNVYQQCYLTIELSKLVRTRLQAYSLNPSLFHLNFNPLHYFSLSSKFSLSPNSKLSTKQQTELEFNTLPGVRLNFVQGLN